MKLICDDYRNVRLEKKVDFILCDMCMGSGSTGIACKELNRDFIGIEIDEKYFNIASERLESDKE